MLENIKLNQVNYQDISWVLLGLSSLVLHVYKNLGIWDVFRQHTLHEIIAFTKSRYFKCCNIGRIRSVITEDACRTSVRSLITSSLDYENALLFGTSITSLQKLQKLPNTAAKLVTSSRKHKHAPSILISPYRLPVKYRMYTFSRLYMD